MVDYSHSNYCSSSGKTGIQNNNKLLTILDAITPCSRCSFNYSSRSMLLIASQEPWTCRAGFPSSKWICRINIYNSITSAHLHFFFPTSSPLSLFLFSPFPTYLSFFNLAVSYSSSSYQHCDLGLIHQSSWPIHGLLYILKRQSKQM